MTLWVLALLAVLLLVLSVVQSWRLFVAVEEWRRR